MKLLPLLFMLLPIGSCSEPDPPVELNQMGLPQEIEVGEAGVEIELSGDIDLHRVIMSTDEKYTADGHTHSEYAESKLNEATGILKCECNWITFKYVASNPRELKLGIDSLKSRTERNAIIYLSHHDGGAEIRIYQHPWDMPPKIVYEQPKDPI